jgi:hypothetical protein
MLTISKCAPGEHLFGPTNPKTYATCTYSDKVRMKAFIDKMTKKTDMKLVAVMNGVEEIGRTADGTKSVMNDPWIFEEHREKVSNEIDNMTNIVTDYNNSVSKYMANESIYCRCDVYGNPFHKQYAIPSKKEPSRVYVQQPPSTKFDVLETINVDCRQISTWSKITLTQLATLQEINVNVIGERIFAPLKEQLLKSKLPVKQVDTEILLKYDPDYAWSNSVSEQFAEYLKKYHGVNIGMIQKLDGSNGQYDCKLTLYRSVKDFFDNYQPYCKKDEENTKMLREMLFNQGYILCNFVK